MKSLVTYVALLRGINVGGNRKIDMKSLKSLFERLGLHNVRTYINPGNVVFDSADERRALTSLIESHIEEEFGFSVMVLLRDAENIATLVGALGEEWANDPSWKCDVMFLGESIDHPDVLEFTDLAGFPATGETGKALFLLIWCLLVVSSIDNVIRPFFISGRAKIPILVVALGVLGGIVSLVFLGIVVVPLFFAVALELFRIYRDDILPERAAAAAATPDA